jgi:hypothetical protein
LKYIAFQAAETVQIDADMEETKLLRVLLVEQKKQQKLRTLVEEGNK